MARTWLSRFLCTVVWPAAQWLLRWCFEGCVAYGSWYGAVPSARYDDPRYDGELTEWAARRLGESRRGHSRHQGPGSGTAIPS